MSLFQILSVAAVLLAWSGIVWCLAVWTERDRQGRRQRGAILDRIVREAKAERGVMLDGIAYREGGTPRLVRHDGVCSAPGSFDN